MKKMKTNVCGFVVAAVLLSCLCALPSCTVTRPKTMHVEFTGTGFCADSVNMKYDLKTEKLYDKK